MVFSEKLNFTYIVLKVQPFLLMKMQHGNQDAPSDMISAYYYKRIQVRPPAVPSRLPCMGPSINNVGNKGRVKNWSKLPRDSTKKLPSKIQKNCRHCLWMSPMQFSSMKRCRKWATCLLRQEIVFSIGVSFSLFSVKKNSDYSWKYLFLLLFLCLLIEHWKQSGWSLVKAYQI